MIGMRNAVFALLVLVCLEQGCTAYPDLFAVKHTKNSCLDHPSKLQRYGGHGTLRPDSQVGILITKKKAAVKVLCPGEVYEVKVTFPSPRLALVSSSLATLSGGTNKTCANQVTTRKRVPVSSFSTKLRVSCAASGRELDFKVTSAASEDGSLRFTRALLPVDSADSPQCEVVSKACSPAVPVQIKAQPADSSKSVFVPLTPNKYEGSQDKPKDIRGPGPGEPVYAFQPILSPDNKWLWQFLHSLLMLLSFGLLLPLGSLLARHKWMFGRDVMSSQVLTTWAPIHVGSQVLGLLAAIGGVVIAILGFGWKTVPGAPLYAPHKWAGVGIMGMALIQLVIGMLRPGYGARGRSCWNTLHHSFGRLTVLAGMGNLILGCLLFHDMKGESYLHWLLPTCIVLGIMLILALILEAFKMQMQRTYRYHHKTRSMLPVMDGFKQSKRRAEDRAAKRQLSPSSPSSQSGYASTSPDEGDDTEYRDADSPLHYPAVTHRGASAVKTSVKPPQLAAQQ